MGLGLRYSLSPASVFATSKRKTFT